MQIGYILEPHSRSLTVEGLGVASARFLAIDLVAGILNRQSHHEDNCYLGKESVSTWTNRSLNQYHSHSGRVSSHFFFRLRQVIHPVFVRLLKFLFRFFGSDCADNSLRSLGYAE
jgi:hypothetical protein